MAFLFHSCPINSSLFRTCLSFVFVFSRGLLLCRGLLLPVFAPSLIFHRGLRIIKLYDSEKDQPKVEASNDEFGNDDEEWNEEDLVAIDLSTEMLQHPTVA